MFLVAHLAEHVDVDLWRNEADDSRLRIGLDHIVPYADSTKSWPSPTIGQANRMELLAILKMANKAYPNGSYWEFAEKLEEQERKFHRTNLAYPLMR